MCFNLMAILTTTNNQHVGYGIGVGKKSVVVFVVWSHGDWGLVYIAKLGNVNMQSTNKWLYLVDKVFGPKLLPSSYNVADVVI